MNTARLRVLPLVLVVACGDSSSQTATDSSTATAGSTGAGPSSGTDGTGTSATGTPTTGGGSNSESDSMTPTSGTTAGTTTSNTTTSGPTTDTTASTSTTASSDTDSTSTGTTSMGASDSSTGSSTTGPQPPVCGNGVIEDGEECDDGNQIPDDKCSNGCTNVPCDQQNGGGNPGMFDFSYLWVSNSPAGTVSKIDTATATEVARYVSGPAGKQDPSRTSVSGDGRFAVAVNRNGGITMYAAEEEDCVDKNNNGMIETSAGPGNVLAWGSDECQIWNVDLPGTSNQGPRPVSWNIGLQDPVTCKYGMGDVWVGWYTQNANSGHFRLLNGEDGATLQNVTVNNWSGMNWGPYGGAIDSENNFWAIGWGQNGPVVKIDGQNFQATHYGNPGGWIYGMGLDLKGNTWAAGCGNGNVYKFDKVALQWSLVASIPNTSCLRGLQVDSKGRAFIAKNGGCGLAVINTETNQVINANVPIAGCSTPVGVSIDAEGFVWVVDQGASRAFKIDPDTYAKVAEVTGLVSPYTYSDMTGAGIAAQILPQ